VTKKVLSLGRLPGGVQRGICDPKGLTREKMGAPREVKNDLQSSKKVVLNRPSGSYGTFRAPMGPKSSFEVDFGSICSGFFLCFGVFLVNVKVSFFFLHLTLI